MVKVHAAEAGHLSLRQRVLGMAAKPWIGDLLRTRVRGEKPHYFPRIFGMPRHPDAQRLDAS